MRTNSHAPRSCELLDASRRARRGAVLIGVLFVGLALSALALAASLSGLAAVRELERDEELAAAHCVAQAGLAEAWAALLGGGDGNVGAADAPVAFGSSTYFVEATELGDELVSLVATGRRDRQVARHELVARRRPGEGTPYAAFGELSLRIDAEALVDSFDSSLGSYAAQAVNSGGLGPFAGEDALVGANGLLLLDLEAEVHGSALPGPAATLLVLGDALLTGSSAPAPEPFLPPAIDVPLLPDEGRLTVAAGTTLRLSPGDHRFRELRVRAGATLIVPGPADLVCGSLVLEVDARLRFDTADCPVRLFVLRDLIFGPHSLVASLRELPEDLEILVLSDNIIDPDLRLDLDDVVFDVGSRVYASIRAPRARIELESDFELFGSIWSRRLRLDGAVRIHFDDRLRRPRCGEPGELEPVLRRVLSPKS